MNLRILALGLLLTPIATQAFAEPCDDMIRDLVAYANQPDGTGFKKSIRFNLMTLKKPARWIAVIADGTLDAVGTGLKHGQNKQLFSDRHIGSQRFDLAKFDRTTVEISENGQMKYLLDSWSNATTIYNTTCSNGFMYATSGEHFHVLSFDKAINRVLHSNGSGTIAD